MTCSSAAASARKMERRSRSRYSFQKAAALPLPLHSKTTASRLVAALLFYSFKLSNQYTFSLGAAVLKFWNYLFIYYQWRNSLPRPRLWKHVDTGDEFRRKNVLLLPGSVGGTGTVSPRRSFGDATSRRRQKNSLHRIVTEVGATRLTLLWWDNWII